MTTGGLVSPDGAAEWLDVSRTVTYRLMRSGDLPFIRIGRLRRIAVADLEAFVSGREAALAIDHNFNTVAGGTR